MLDYRKISQACHMVCRWNIHLCRLVLDDRRFRLARQLHNRQCRGECSHGQYIRAVCAEYDCSWRMEYKLHSTILVFVPVLLVCIGAGALQGAFCNFGHWSGDRLGWLFVSGVVAPVFLLLAVQPIHRLYDRCSVFYGETMAPRIKTLASRFGVGSVVHSCCRMCCAR